MGYNRRVQASGIIFDIKKFAIHDGPGIRTTVFFKGCPLDCWWCQNPEGVKAAVETLTVKNRGRGSASSGVRRKETVGRGVTAGEVMEEIVKDRVFYEQSGGGATFSGGEPLLQVEFLRVLLEECRKRRIKTAVDTSGYAPWEAFGRIADLVDVFLYDIKIMDNTDHEKYTGVSNRLILENLSKLCEHGENVTVRVPLVPGISDTRENLEAVADFVESRPEIHGVSLLPYNKLCEDKFDRFTLEPRLAKHASQTNEQLAGMVAVFESRTTGDQKIKIGG